MIPGVAPGSILTKYYLISPVFSSGGFFIISTVFVGTAILRNGYGYITTFRGWRICCFAGAAAVGIIIFSIFFLISSASGMSPVRS